MYPKRRWMKDMVDDLNWWNIERYKETEEEEDNNFLKEGRRS